MPAAELAEVSRDSDGVIPAALQVIEIEPLPPLPPSAGAPEGALEPPLPAIPPWVPLPPEGNSQLDWASHWDDIFEDLDE